MSKKKSTEDGEAKEHKQPWQEKYATVGEIKAFLSDHVYLRYNTVKHRVEARVPPGDPFIEHSELAEFVSDMWQPMSDRLRSTLLMVLQTLKDTREKDLLTVLGLPEPPAALGWAGLYPRTLSDSQRKGRCGGTAVLLRRAEAVARGHGGQLAR